MPLIDEVGKRYGRLTVLARAESKRKRERVYARWLCRCDCGAQHVATGVRLRSGETRSCGCANSGRGRRFGSMPCVPTNC